MRTVTQITEYGDISYEREEDFNINNCNYRIDGSGNLYFGTTVTADWTGSNFLDNDGTLFYSRITWMEEGNDIVPVIPADRTGRNSCICRFHSRTRQIARTDRRLYDRIHFPYHDQWLVH